MAFLPLLYLLIPLCLFLLVRGFRMLRRLRSPGHGILGWLFVLAGAGGLLLIGASLHRISRAPFAFG